MEAFLEHFGSQKRLRHQSERRLMLQNLKYIDLMKILLSPRTLMICFVAQSVLRGALKQWAINERVVFPLCVWVDVATCVGL